MRILMITPHFPPELSPEAIVNGKLALALKEQGAEVEVVTREPNDQFFGRDDFGCWADMPQTASVAAPRPLWREKASNFATRIRRGHGSITWFAQAAAELSGRLLADRKFDAILTRSGTADGLSAGIELKRRFGRPWLASINDPLPTCLYPPPYGNGQARTRSERGQVKWMQQVLPQADRVIFPGERLGRYLEKKLGLDLGARFTVVPHIGWSRSAQPPMDDRFRILYAGSLGEPRVTTEFLLNFQRALERHPGAGPLSMVFLGRVNDRFREFVVQRRLDKLIVFEEPVSYEQSLFRIAQASALLIMEGTMAEGVFSPSKFSDYAAAQKPLLLFSPEHGEIADQVGGFGHPGFLGQSEERYTKILDRFLERLERGLGLEDYVFPDPSRFSGPAAAGDLLEQLRSID